MNAHEIYKLTYHQCTATVELRAGPPEQLEHRTCPRCGVLMEIVWRDAKARTE